MYVNHVWRGGEQCIEYKEQEINNAKKEFKIAVSFYVYLSVSALFADNLYKL